MDIFIISGQVPGTNHQLTLTDLTAVSILVVLVYLVIKERRFIRTSLSQFRLKQFKAELNEKAYTGKHGDI